MGTGRLRTLGRTVGTPNQHHSYTRDEGCAACLMLIAAAMGAHARCATFRTHHYPGQGALTRAPRRSAGRGCSESASTTVNSAGMVIALGVGRAPVQPTD